MSANGLSHVYARYVPRLIIERLVRESRAVDAPSAEGFQGAVLFADISGFTPLTEAFAARGPAGAEALTRILNDYFGRMTAIVFDHGGDVLKFAGDALMALWRANEDGSGLSEACIRATACGLELQRALAGYEADGHPLALRVAVGVGDATVVHVGGQFNRWEFAIAGSPLNQVGATGDLADKGDVLVSPEVWARIGGRCEGEMVNDPDADPERTEVPARRIIAIDAPAPEPAPPAPALPDELEDALRGYLPASITRRIMAGQTDFLGELRRITVLFVNLPDITYSTPLEVGQQAFRGLQKALYLPWEGSINKLSVDDKGISLIAALGLPPFAHEDDAARGAQAAMAMHKVLADLGQRCSIGVTTGRVYCGSVGGDDRQEYTIMGDRVNLAARLMQNAAGGILCDAATAERSADVVEYAPPDTIRVKGKAEALEVYRPVGTRERAVAEKNPALVIGRDAELARLHEAVTALVDDGENVVVYVEGEAGVGKTRLLTRFVDEVAAQQPVRVLRGAADAIEQSTSYYAWQHVLLELFGLEHEADTTRRRERITGSLAKDAAVAERLPLLNDILPLEIPETELTRQMSGAVRASNLETLVVNLLQYSAARKALLLFMEDAHWMDSASWALLRRCADQVQPFLVLLGSRPVELTEAPEPLRAMLAGTEARTLRLERMDPDDCVRLVAERLGVGRLPDAAAALIRERGEGHPYFSEEIGYALRDSGALLVQDGHARMASASGDLGDVDLPDTIEGIITSRIDRLTPQQQLALKVASCIGRVFTMRLLQDVYPVGRDRATLSEQLDGLTRLDLTHPEDPDDDPAWVFKHAITRQVTYDLMLYAQRKQLHEAIADWYEHTYPDDLGPYYPLLAHHWGRADNDEKAVQYLTLAARTAQRANANAEVIEFVEEARERAARLPTPPTAMQRARWLTMVGFARHGLGELDKARELLEEALGVVGYPAPASTPALVGSILRQIAIQARHRRRGRPSTPADADVAERLELAADTVQRLFLVYFFANDSARMLWSCLRSTNLAEAIGRDTPVLIRCYTDLALATISIPLPSQSEYYSERAMDAAEHQDALAERAWADVGTSAALAATGQWTEIERRSLEAVDINRELGDLRAWEEASANLALIRTIYGRFDEPEDSLYMPVLQQARKRKIFQSEGWGLAIWGLNLQYMQRFAELDDLVAQLVQWYAVSSEGMDDIARLEALDLMLLAAMRHDDDVSADLWYAEGQKITDAMGRPSQYRVLPALYLFTEACIDWWRRAPDDGERRARAKVVERRIGALQTYAGIFPIGEARLAWIRGRWAWLRGKEAAAIGFWRACAEAAERTEMAYDAMLAASALGRVLPPGEERDRQLDTGAELAEEMGIPGSGFLPDARA